jgi:Mg2+/Co2+ transporter CorB
MTPRNEIHGIDIEKSIEDIIQQIKNSPYSCIPVYKKSIDRVIGFLNVKSILTCLFDEEPLTKQYLTDNLITPFFIPETTPLHKQIQDFKFEQIRIGLVVDEYGDVQGLVSLDDLLQGLVGELMVEEADVKKLPDGSYLVNGSVTIRDFNRITQWDFPTEGPKTINGLIIDFMETIPQTGVSLLLHGHHLEVISCNKHAITQIRFLPQD